MIIQINIIFHIVFKYSSNISLLQKEKMFLLFSPEYCMHLCLMLIPLSIDQLFQPIALILSSRKSKKKRERSNSSSSSSSSSFVRDEETKSTEKSLAQLQGRKCVESTEMGQAHGGFVSLHQCYSFLHEHTVMYLYYLVT